MRAESGRPVIRAWLAAHKSLVATATSGTAVVALVTTLAVVSGGYTAQHLQLGDAAVWVAGDAKKALGRANTEIDRLNSVAAGTGESLDVVQNGRDVLMLDKEANTVAVVDPATSEAGKAVALPARDPRVDIAGDTVSLLSQATGQLWLTTVSQLSEFNAGSGSTMDLGGRTVAAMDPGGALFAYQPATRAGHPHRPHGAGPRDDVREGARERRGRERGDHRGERPVGGARSRSAVALPAGPHGRPRARAPGGRRPGPPEAVGHGERGLARDRPGVSSGFRSTAAPHPGRSGRRAGSRCSGHGRRLHVRRVGRGRRLAIVRRIRLRCAVRARGGAVERRPRLPHQRRPGRAERLALRRLLGGAARQRRASTTGTSSSRRRTRTSWSTSRNRTRLRSTRSSSSRRWRSTTSSARVPDA